MDHPRTPLLEDSHQHGLMLAAYREVGSDYSVDNGQLMKGLRPCRASSLSLADGLWPGSQSHC